LLVAWWRRLPEFVAGFPFLFDASYFQYMNIFATSVKAAPMRLPFWSGLHAPCAVFIQPRL